MTDFPDFFLYHATYNVYLISIKENGLGGVRPKNWPDSVPGSVCFAKDPYCAESYAETAECVPDGIYDSGIAILCVDSRSAAFDSKLLRKDRNNLAGDTFEYAGVVPPAELYVWRGDGLTPLLTYHIEAFLRPN